MILTSGPEILTSNDGTNYSVISLPFNQSLSRIVYGNGLYVGINGTLIASSSDLVHWHSYSAGATLTSIAFGGGTFTVVGNATVLTSTDGVNWSAQVAPNLLPYDDVAYGNGKFVLAPGTTDGRLLVSNDGTNWSSEVISSSNVSFQWMSFANGKFYASGAYSIPSVWGSFSTNVVSSDGMNWQPVSVSPTLPTADDFRVMAGNGGLLGVCTYPYAFIGSSTDGSSFAGVSPNGWLGSSVAFGNGRYIDSSLQVSLDGTNWSPAFVSPTNTGYSVTNLFLGRDGSYITLSSPLLFSPNGLSFSFLTNTLPVSVRAVGFGNGLYVAVGAAGALIQSTNGLNWVVRNSATSQALSDVTYGNSLWVSVGAGGAITASSTGNAWGLRTSGTTLALNGITYAGNLFVTVGDSGSILTSPDGNTWAPQYSGTTEQLVSIAYGDGQFVAVGANDTILASADATNWTVVASGSGQTLQSIAFGDGTFFVTGSVSGGGSGYVYFTSTNGLLWDSCSVPLPYNGLNPSVRFLNGTFFVFSGANILQSGPVVPVQLNESLSSGGPKIIVQSSSNLLLRLQSADSVEGPWQDEGIFTNLTGTFIWSDPSATGQAQRFYRAIAP